MRSARKQLIGTWRSDKRRTLQNCHRYHCLLGAKKRRFGGLFGKLELRYTLKYVYYKLRGVEYRGRYEVVAEDAESIVIRIHSDELKKKMGDLLTEGLDALFEPRLEQISFRCYRGRQYYWIGLGGFCEWFQRLGSQRAGGTARRERASDVRRTPLVRRR